MVKRKRLARSAVRKKRTVTRLQLLTIDDLHGIVAPWFIARFNKTPEQDKAYFQEWMERFRRGNPERYMDNESLAVFRKMYRMVG